MEYAEKSSLLPKCRSSTAVEGVNVSHFGDAKREKENAESLTLPDRVVDAYAQGALPLNTLANAVLARHDQMRQMASENYEANERETIVRPLAQR